MGLCDAVHKQGSLITRGTLVAVRLYTVTFTVTQHRDIHMYLTEVCLYRLQYQQIFQILLFLKMGTVNGVGNSENLIPLTYRPSQFILNL